MKTNPCDMVYSYSIVRTPRDEYGEERLTRYLERYGNRIVDFRPPRIDEEYLTAMMEREVDRCGLDFYMDTPRFILGPPPKPLKKFLVEVWDEPPKVGDTYVYHSELQNGAFLGTRCGDNDRDYENKHKATLTEVKE